MIVNNRNTRKVTQGVMMDVSSRSINHDSVTFIDVTLLLYQVNQVLLHGIKWHEFTALSSKPVGNREICTVISTA